MHIPDGYLGPKTFVTMWGAMLPVWYVGGRKLKGILSSRQIPFVALAASYSFVIMMFNVPAPGGSSGHAVGSGLIAILLGPWISLFAVTIALIIQALLFGDGGVTALGANCFNMAFVMSFSGYYIYRFMQSFGGSIKWKSFSAGVAGYLSLNIGAFLTALQFGVQPLLERSANGTPLYAPYSLKVAISVMMAEHLLIFGFIEAALGAMIVAYMLGQGKDLLPQYGFRGGLFDGYEISK